MVKKFHLDDKVLKENGVGYVQDKRFNLDWESQGLNCPYEHCIETMPLHEDEAAKARKLGYFTIFTGGNWVSCSSSEPGATEDLNRVILEFGYSQKSCGLFGHKCPGEEKQVKECELE